MSSIWDDLVNFAETEAAAAGGVAASWAANPGQVGTALTAPLTDWKNKLTENLAALAVGLGLFALGTTMIAVSALDDLVGAVNKTQRSAGQIAKLAALVP